MAQQTTQYPNPAFCATVRASGAGELQCVYLTDKELYLGSRHKKVWNHVEDHQSKFNQYGWRCVNSESGYCAATLIGNWAEERRDVRQLQVPKPLPSDRNHNFQTTYCNGYGCPVHRVPEELKGLKRRLPIAYPALQPELDPPMLKAQWSTWKTESQREYVNHSLPKPSPPSQDQKQAAQCAE